MLFSPRNVLLVTTILVTILSFTKKTDAGIPILDEVMAIWSFVDAIKGAGEDPHKEIMDKFTEVFKSLDEVKEQISGVSDSIDSLGQLVRISSELQPPLNDIFNHIYKINVWADKAQKMSKHFSRYQEESLLEFADDVVKGGDTATICMEKLLEMVTDKRLQGRNMIQMLMKYNEVDICEKIVTTPQLLYTFYHQLLITEAKGLAAMQFSFMVLRRLKQKKYSQEINEAKESVENRVKKLTKTFASLIPSADKTIYKCDPKNHREGHTFDRLTRLVQGYITNQKFLSRERSCSGYCDQYQSTILGDVPCRDYNLQGYYCTSPCRNGITFGCNNAHYYGDSMTACHNTDGSLKRYLWADGVMTYGKKTDTCDDEITFRQWMFNGINCHACFCLCDEEGPNSDRFFNLDEVKSDIRNNKVLTGIRLKKHNRVFHFEIQQGKLLSYGAIDPRTLEWIDKPSYHQSYDQQNIYKMNYYDNSISLDEHRANDPNYVVTGIQFLPLKNILEYQVHLTRFNFSNGKLDTSDSKWISSNADKYERIPIVLSEPDESELNSESNSTWQPNQYVEFTHTDWKKDLAQTTIPYIDIQPVVNTPAAPLSGVGLYHKGKQGFGGFVGAKLLAYEYDMYLEERLKS